MYCRGPSTGWNPAHTGCSIRRFESHTYFLPQFINFIKTPDFEYGRLSLPATQSLSAVQKLPYWQIFCSEELRSRAGDAVGVKASKTGLDQEVGEVLGVDVGRATGWDKAARALEILIKRTGQKNNRESISIFSLTDPHIPTAANNPETLMGDTPAARHR